MAKRKSTPKPKSVKPATSRKRPPPAPELKTRRKVRGAAPPTKVRKVIPTKPQTTKAKSGREALRELDERRKAERHARGLKKPGRKPQAEGPVIRPEHYPDIADLMGQGYSHRAIADHYGCAPTLIRLIAQKHILPMMADRTRYSLEYWLAEIVTQREQALENVRQLQKEGKTLRSVSDDCQGWVRIALSTLKHQAFVMQYDVSRSELRNQGDAEEYRVAGQSGAEVIRKMAMQVLKVTQNIAERDSKESALEAGDANG